MCLSNNDICYKYLYYLLAFRVIELLADSKPLAANVK